MIEAIVRVHRLAQLLGVHRNTLRRWEQTGALPPRRSFGPNTTGWLESEIAEFIATRPMADADTATVPEGR